MRPVFWSYEICHLWLRTASLETVAHEATEAAQKNKE